MCFGGLPRRFCTDGTGEFGCSFTSAKPEADNALRFGLAEAAESLPALPRLCASEAGAGETEDEAPEWGLRWDAGDGERLSGEPAPTGSTVRESGGESGEG